jgi:hypothetical protein
MHLTARLRIFVLVATGTFPLSAIALGAPVGQIPAPTQAPLAIASQPPSYAQYNYMGDRYRDPFIPLIGEGVTNTALDRPPQVASLVLKGIVQDAKGRMALLNSGVSSYILRGGRLYDGNNKMVKGIAGVIKQESALLIGPDHTPHEVFIKKTL